MYAQLMSEGGYAPINFMRGDVIPPGTHRVVYVTKLGMSDQWGLVKTVVNRFTGWNLFSGTSIITPIG